MKTVQSRGKTHSGPKLTNQHSIFNNKANYITQAEKSNKIPKSVQTSARDQTLDHNTTTKFRVKNLLSQQAFATQ